MSLALSVVIHIVLASLPGRMFWNSAILFTRHWLRGQLLRQSLSFQKAPVLQLVGQYLDRLLTIFSLHNNTHLKSSLSRGIPDNVSSNSVFVQQLPVARRREDPDSEPEPEGYQPPPQVNLISTTINLIWFCTKPFNRRELLGLFTNSAATPSANESWGCFSSCTGCNDNEWIVGWEEEGEEGEGSAAWWSSQAHPLIWGCIFPPNWVGVKMVDWGNILTPLIAVTVIVTGNGALGWWPLKFEVTYIAFLEWCECAYLCALRILYIFWGVHWLIFSKESLAWYRFL